MAATFHELARVKAAASMKSAEIAALFQEAEAAPEARKSTIAQAIKTANGELAKLTDEAESIHTALKTSAELRRPVDKQVDPAEDIDVTSFSSDKVTTPRETGASWGKTVLQAAHEQAAVRGLKAMLPSGTAVVAVPLGGPIENPRRARFLSELMPAKDAPGGNFRYLRQTVRTIAAAVVPDGDLKPESNFELEEIDESVDVIAHLSNATPRHYFEDSDNVVQFVDQEMRYGVNLALDAKIVSEVFGASGLLVEGDIGTTIDTCRRAITRLQEREVEPSAFVLHPRDWEQIELEMTTGFAANSNMPAPTDEVRRSLFGIPVVVSNALTENTGLLGDFRESAALYRTGGVRVDWSEAFSFDDSTTGFQRNLIQFRAEGRFGVAVLRSFAFVSINLAGTGS